MDNMVFVKPLLVISFCIVAKNYSDLKFSLKSFALWVLAAYVLVGTALYFNEILGSIIMLAIIVLMVYLKTSKILPSVMTAMFTMITLIIANAIGGTLLDGVYNDIDFYAVVGDDWKLYLLLVTINFLIAYTVSKYAGKMLHKNIKKKPMGGAGLTSMIIFTVTVSMVLVFLYISMYSRQVYQHSELILIYIAFFAFLMIFAHYIFSALSKEARLENSKRELRQMERYMANIESMYNDIRSIRHDYVNVISSMAGYLDDEDMDGLRGYFRQEIVPFAGRLERADSNIAVLAKLKNPSLKGITAVKLMYAQKMKILIMVDIKDDIFIEDVEILDLNRVMGILLDNAIEAAGGCKKPFVHIGFIKENNRVTIAVVNSTKEKQVDINKMFKNGFSSKGENRGVGLFNVTQILSIYSNILLDTEAGNGRLQQTVYIEKARG